MNLKDLNIFSVYCEYKKDINTVKNLQWWNVIEKWCYSCNWMSATLMSGLWLEICALKKKNHTNETFRFFMCSQTNWLIIVKNFYKINRICVSDVGERIQEKRHIDSENTPKTLFTNEKKTRTKNHHRIDLRSAAVRRSLSLFPLSFPLVHIYGSGGWCAFYFHIWTRNQW